MCTLRTHKVVHKRADFMISSFLCWSGGSCRSRVDDSTSENWGHFFFCFSTLEFASKWISCNIFRGQNAFPSVELLRELCTSKIVTLCTLEWANLYENWTIYWQQRDEVVQSWWFRNSGKKSWLHKQTNERNWLRNWDEKRRGMGWNWVGLHHAEKLGISGFITNYLSSQSNYWSILCALLYLHGEKLHLFTLHFYNSAYWHVNKTCTNPPLVEIASPKLVRFASFLFQGNFSSRLEKRSCYYSLSY